MKRRVGSWTSAAAKASASSDSISVASVVEGASGEHISRQSSRNERRCCGSSKTCSAAPTRGSGNQLDQHDPMWVNYFAVGHASECFGYIQDWVEKKIRRHMMRAPKRKSFGWTRWSRQWLYETPEAVQHRWLQPKVAPAG